MTKTKKSYLFNCLLLVFGQASQLTGSLGKIPDL